MEALQRRVSLAGWALFGVQVLDGLGGAFVSLKLVASYFIVVGEWILRRPIHQGYCAVLDKAGLFSSLANVFILC